MLPTNVLKQVLFDAIKEHEVLGKFPEIAKDEHKKVTEGNARERIVINVPATSNGDWQISYANIAVYVPKIKVNNQYMPDTAKLTYYEQICCDTFYKSTLIRKGNDTVRYEADYIIQEDDSETWSNFINVRLKITNTNFKL